MAPLFGPALRHFVCVCFCCVFRVRFEWPLALECYTLYVCACALCAFR